jgi:hypothetical protein
MAFGQQAGPPATGRQVQELLTLLHGAGHDDFRDARGPMGFTQRQAAGKFTRDEADAFIGRLQETESDSQGADSGASRWRQRETPAPPARSTSRPASPGRSLSAVDTPRLVAELRRRGWTVTEP